MKPTLISGIQPTGPLHLGNYLGALKNFVNLQNSEKYECFFFIADLHALTENPEAKDLSENIISLASDFLAAGLDPRTSPSDYSPKKSTIFQQSQIESLQELKWILSTLTPVSELMRMTTFKEKVLQALKPEEREKITKKEFEEIVEQTNFGLAEYPILMAADILLYDGQLVPVGNDQLQHLEFARTLVRKFNNKFGQTFIEPKALMTSTPRLMSLDDPSKKMSKSQPAGCLFINDSPEDIERKIKNAVTDSGSEVKYDPKNKPAISNLMLIYATLKNEEVEPPMGGSTSQKLKEVENHFAGKSYFEFKKSLAKVVADYFDPFRKRKYALLQKPAALKKILSTGSKQAQKIAARKILEVKEKIGLLIL